MPASSVNVAFGIPSAMRRPWPTGTTRSPVRCSTSAGTWTAGRTASQLTRYPTCRRARAEPGLTPDRSRRRYAETAWSFPFRLGAQKARPHSIAWSGNGAPKASGSPSGPRVSSTTRRRRMPTFASRSAVSPGSARSLMKLGYQIDWEAVLPRIQVPTLILHRIGDLVVPIRQARKLAEGIPGARFVELPGIDHLMWAGDHDAIVDAVRSFLEEAGVSSGSETALPGLVSAQELGLTRREREVLRLVGRGLTNRQIAATLFISTKTAGVHVSNILAKMGVERRAEAAAVAERLHLLTPPPEELHPAPTRPT